jgi:CBS domain containing-hemolysin-like protein
MILIQDLLLNDPADKVPLRAVMDYYKHRVPRCTMDSSLESMFDLFRKGDSHMAFVYVVKETPVPTLRSRPSDHQLTVSSFKDLNNNGHLMNNQNNLRRMMNRDETSSGVQVEEAVGILTLENIIEELVQSDIMDEADTKRERRRKS